MRRNIVVLLGLLIMVTGCAPTAPAENAGSTKEAALTSEGEAEAPVVSPGETVVEPEVDRYADAPESAKTIGTLLMARHTEDLPTAEVLAAHTDAEAALCWLARDGDPLVQRVRALSTLRFYEGEQTRALLLEVLGDVDAHPTLHAGAVAGSGAFDLNLDEALRAAVEGVASGGDPRVEKAVTERLR